MIPLKKMILSFFESNYAYDCLILISLLIILLLLSVFDFKRYKLPDRYLILGKGISIRDSVIDYVSKYSKNMIDILNASLIDIFGVIVGVNGDFDIGQMLHETNFLKFEGEFKKSQNNFSALGIMETVFGKHILI